MKCFLFESRMTNEFDNCTLNLYCIFIRRYNNISKESQSYLGLFTLILFLRVKSPLKISRKKYYKIETYFKAAYIYMKDCATFLMYSIILWSSSLCDIKGISYISYIKEKAIPPLNRTRTRHKSCKLFFLLSIFHSIHTLHLVFKEYWTYCGWICL